MKTPDRRRALARISALVLGATLAGGSLAQAAYPDKPIRLIVPFPPSGSTDIVARTVAERLGAALGQNIIVDNKPGATGAIGLEALARAQPDGYTIGLATIGSIAINPAVNRKLTWDPQKDFAPVGYIGSTPFALIVNNNLPVNSLESFIALAKQKPGQLTYATGGNGGSQHVAAVLLEDMAGISMRQIPYKGSGPALMDLIGGRRRRDDRTGGLGRAAHPRRQGQGDRTHRRQALRQLPRLGERQRNREGLRSGGLVRAVRARQHAARHRHAPEPRARHDPAQSAGDRTAGAGRRGSGARFAAAAGHLPRQRAGEVAAGGGQGRHQGRLSAAQREERQ
ncbi:tripartite tricarboxylate transporter substrate binding protein [Ramlibacter terrae]|uniref:Tripartite tricarboxylate transporter substrate binding protein n=1 Tax=Ramlibacter terrae TaxID=2732511 RepID=A0ABX6P2W1_9BURK|nr:tripartite tricarboxylate transporter substrate binding protein [Ramlibacter terrae]